jgi:hypothetical protein
VIISTDPEFRKAIGTTRIRSLFIQGFVYFAVSVWRKGVKIGFSRDVDRRMTQIRADLLFALPASLAHESAFHRLFGSKRIENEWFRLDADDLDRAKAILQNETV